MTATTCSSSSVPSFRDRAAGAIMGAFIGDALGLGPHWYYDLAELRADYGPWIDDYTDPKPHRYHAGLKAGQLSQAGVILELTLRSLVECGGYDEADFCRRLDEDLFRNSTGNPCPAPVAIRANRFAKRGADVCSSNSHGARPPGTPTPRRPSSAP